MSVAQTWLVFAIPSTVESVRPVGFSVTGWMRMYCAGETVTLLGGVCPLYFRLKMAASGSGTACCLPTVDALGAVRPPSRVG